MSKSGGRSRRLCGKCLVVVVAGTGVLWSQSGVLAAKPPPSVISNLPLSGFAPVSRFTGPVTAANESEILQYSAEGDFEQFLVNNQARAYLRGWSQLEPGGASVQILAMSFNDPSYPARVMEGYKVVSAKLGSLFNVPGIPGALGLSRPAAGSGGPTPESDVIFAKGSSLYLIVFAAQAGAADAIKVARAQFTINNGSHATHRHG